MVTSTPSDAQPRIVIVGAGFAGLAVATRLKRAAARVILIDRHNGHVFQPLLYQVATAALSPSEIVVPVRELFRDAPNVEVLMDEVRSIDRAARRVVCRYGSHDYDTLVLAAGARYTYFGNERWRQRTLCLKSLADAQAIRERILSAFERAETIRNDDERRRYLSFAIVGGGTTGVELAGALADLARRTLPGEFRHIDPRQTKIYLFEAAPALLPGFPPPLQAYAHRALRKRGVTVLLGTAVKDVQEGGIVTAEASFDASTILWAAGVDAHEASRLIGVRGDKQGRVPVRRDCSLPDDPSVFVVGDAAHLELSPGEPLPALASVAKQQGEHVGDLLRRRLEGKPELPPFAYRNWGQLAAIGRGAAAADFGRVRFTGTPAWVTWWLVHIYMLIGFRNRLAVLVNWIWSTLTHRSASRIIIGQVPDEERPRPVEAVSATEEIGWRERSLETEAGLESFPASDPPAYTAGTAGAPARHGDGVERTIASDGDDRVTEAGRQSFPASDPPGYAGGIAGAPRRSDR